MAERDIFRLIIRTIGMISIALGVPGLIGTALSLIGLPVRSGATPLQILAAACAYLISGLALLSLAGPIATGVCGSRADQIEKTPKSPNLDPPAPSA